MQVKQNISLRCKIISTISKLQMPSYFNEKLLNTQKT